MLKIYYYKQKYQKNSFLKNLAKLVSDIGSTVQTVQDTILIQNKMEKSPIEFQRTILHF